MRVGIVGTGEMGRLAVARLLGAGHDVTAFARRAEVRADLTSVGVTVLDRTCEIARGADVVIVYVLTDGQVTTVAHDDGLADALDPGSVLLVATTCNPRTVQAVAERASARGADVLDAPASGGPDVLAAGRLTVFAGGETSVVERCRPVLDAYAATIAHVGAVGAGQQVKLLNNLLFGAQVELAVEAARLGTELGIDAATLARTLHTCSGASYALDLVAAMGSAEALLRRAGSYVHKDVLMARDVARSAGMDLGSIDAIIDPVLHRTAGYDAS